MNTNYIEIIEMEDFLSKLEECEFELLVCVKLSNVLKIQKNKV